MAPKKGKREDGSHEDGKSDSGLDDWHAHERRMMEAVRRSAVVFMAHYAELIKKASSEEAAYRSYVNGTIDTLSVARNALGFWGVEEIRKEFERLNSKRAPKEAGPSPSIGVPGGAKISQGDPAVDMQNIQAEVAELVASRKKAEAGKGRDVMFA
jgi:hypothetical protein